ncbi:MAG: PIN domain-containing protein [Candidatus Wallbacteria bacterium]|nr:PIN domain-containing protein [Candidatus Wallbacteria bacterium]
MNVLFDVNVILDLLLKREPFAADAGELLSMAEEGSLGGFLCATGVTTIHYVARRTIGTGDSRKRLQRLLGFLHVAQVDGSIIDRALRSGLNDFEDAVADEASAAAGVDAIVTRDVADFKGAKTRTYSPSEFIAVLDQENSDSRTE